MRTTGMERERALRNALRKNLEYVDRIARMFPPEDHILQEAARRAPKRRKDGISLEILAMVDRNRNKKTFYRSTDQSTGKRS